ADYSNASGEVLRIIDIVLPTGAQCVGGGLAGTLLAPGAPPPAPPPSCGVGQLLPAGNTCRVDVDTLCRGLVAGILPSISSVTANSGSASGGVGVTVTGTNLGTVTSLTFD